MQISAEIRWFWHSNSPVDLKLWFCGSQSHHCFAGGGVRERNDVYLLGINKQDELGVKYRGGSRGAEIKGLVALAPDPLSSHPFVGNVEIWSKWSLDQLDITNSSTLEVKKLRWMRKFDTSGQPPSEIPLDGFEQPLVNQALPDLGCNVELTQIVLPDGKDWWTFGFEAFGKLTSVSDQLTTVANYLVTRNVPVFEYGIEASYPAWLRLVTKDS